MVENSGRIIESLNATIAEQRLALEALHEIVTAREQTAKVLQAAAEERKLKIEALQATIAEQEQTIAALREQLAEHERHETTLFQALDSEKRDLQHQLALALMLANSAYDPLIVLDDQFLVLAINDSAESLFERRDPIGETLLTLTGSEELQSMVEFALEYQEETFEEQLNIGKRAFRVLARVVRCEGNRFIGLAMQDVSELVRLNRARRDMVANISHELRTPIANIRLIIESLFHEQDKPRRKQSASALKAIAREMDSLLWVVQELRDLSMIETGQAMMRMIDVPLQEMVDEAIERMSDQSEDKGLKIVRVLPENAHVLCDPDLIKRVLINLIHNAIKWSPPGGTITVSAVVGDDNVTIGVQDNGPGVPDAHTERIFERFYQVDSARTGGEGTGLGLAISKHIVEAHEGRIWAVGSSKGEGGHFLFTLPPGETIAQNADNAEFA